MSVAPPDSNARPVPFETVEVFDGPPNWVVIPIAVGFPITLAVLVWIVISA